MSKKTYRHDKTCLNCNYVVENKFCPNCGQENTDTRKTFHHLFIHFFEDLTHYENAFWRTIKNLLFKPAALTKEYLSGKRLSYLAPVRLYIFISFITFFMTSLLPDDTGIEKESKKPKKEHNENKKVKIGMVTFTPGNDSIDNEKDTIYPEEIKLKKLYKEGRLTKKEADTLITFLKESKERNDSFTFDNREYKSIKELDSMQGVDSLKLNKLKYWLVRKLMKVTHQRKKGEVIDKFLESFKHNLPKTLFVIMPIFAFFLWLFHDKKKWYYFDHGIYTLHYFSFMLLVILVTAYFVEFIYLFGENDITESIDSIINICFPIWFIVYFYKANKNFYQQKPVVSFIKSSILMIINFIVLFVVLLFFVIYSFLTIH